MSRILKIGSRRSALAKLQSYLVAAALKEKYSDLEIEFIFKESMGDKDLVTPLWQMGDRGVFTKDFVEDLLQEKVDVVIHSWKDLDLKKTEGTEILSVLDRVDQRDLLLYKKSSFANPAATVRIHSSSPRREYNLKRLLKKALPSRLQNKEIVFEPVRGNMSTRLRKWQESELDGIIVAKAAIDRLLSENFPESSLEEYREIRRELRQFLDDSLFMCLPLSENPNAPAQGALAAEVKSGRKDILEIISSIRNMDVQQAVDKERKILGQYGGGCHQKIGVACLHRSFGEVTWLKGLTDGGVTLDEQTLVARHRHPAASKEKIWPVSRVALEFNRNPLPCKLPNGDIWVSRASAWQDDWKADGRIIWCAGLKTMYALAAKDVWVNGSSEALGESEQPDIDILLGRKTEFVKVTHSESGNVKSGIDRVYSYKLELQSEIPDLSDKTHFFWMSGYQFDLVLEKNPGIRDGYHSCGPGITADHIRKRLGDKGKIDYYLNFEDWFTYHTK